MDKSSWLSRCSLSFINLTLILFSVNLHAFQQTTNELTLSALADLSTITLNNDKWQSVLPVIGSNSEYFLASKNGKVYLLNNEKATTTAILDLTRHFNNKTIHGLTAIAIDPSFAYRDRNGYNTFYTAHIEETTSSNKTSNNKLDISAGSNSTRNTDSYTDKNLPYDTVITRWQLSSSQHQPSTVSQFHEVLRIPIQKTNEAIRQLSFNPYTESWHEDFGLLYVLLSKTDNEEMSEKALYSGTVLRIKPERFGLQSYTIPLNNPFMRNADIRNEIVIMTGANIINFDWLKNGKTRLLLQLDSVEQNTLIQAKLGDDFRNNLPPVSEQAKITKQASDTSNKVILYQGRELKNLWGKVLQLNNVDKNWQLQALSLTPNTEPPFSVTANFANLAHSNGEKLSLHRHSNNELLVLAHNQQLLYSISAAPEEIVPTTATVQAPASNKGNSHLLLILLIIFASLSSYLWYVKFRAGKKQHFLHSQWANFDVNTATKSLSLYKRHEKSVGKIVNISTLKNSEILLNDEVISVISADPQQGFSNSLEEQVLNYFAKEHRLKMVNDKQRKIQLRLTDTTEASFMFCLYYRVGNIRHTKLKYHKVLDKVIDWNWLFSQFINAEHTSKRKIRVKIKPKVKLNSSQNTAELNQQAGSQPPINQNQESNTPVKPLKQSSTTEADIAINQDTELVTALDKLVAMKKQGFLSEDEFNIAKTKIINDLMKQ